MKIYKKEKNVLNLATLDADKLVNKQKHNKLYYYTKWEYFENSYENKVLSLGNLRKQNDKDEKRVLLSAVNTEHFIQCFSLTNEESTSMWGLYGIVKDAICVVFDFDGSGIFQEKFVRVKIAGANELYSNAILRRQNILYVESKPYNPNDRSKGSYVPFKIKNKKYYKYLEDTNDKPASHESLQLSEICRSVLSEYQGFIKRKGWEHEREYRYLLEVNNINCDNTKIEDLRAEVTWDDLGLQFVKIYYKDEDIGNKIRTKIKAKNSVIKSDYFGHFDYNLPICPYIDNCISVKSEQ